MHVIFTCHPSSNVIHKMTVKIRRTKSDCMNACICTYMDIYSPPYKNL